MAPKINVKRTGPVSVLEAEYLLSYLANRKLSWMVAKLCEGTAEDQWLRLRVWHQRMEDGETAEEAMDERDRATRSA